ncbi:TraM recognition domain-containing protein [Microbacteriaceae bacterium VKM Ac-2854]|nr:TraM recognition domain-containing protein [Microbacteriaceae bacterium VKM Ac-2854]
MREPGRRGDDAVLLAIALSVLAIIAVFWFALAAGSALSGANPALPRDPFEVVGGLVDGTVVWPATSSALAAVGVALLVTLLVCILRARSRARPGLDHLARYLAGPRELAHRMRREALRTSTRLGVSGSPGIPLGALVQGGATVFASYEDMMILIAGPRVGKSTGLVIPAILAAPGAVVTTSNKRDVLDATRDVRASSGEVWVFDPQRVALEPASWWWNPLSSVTDDTKAERLAQHFAAGSKTPGAAEDAFFDPKGQSFLAGLLLAAAVGRRPVSQVYTWLTNPSDAEPIRLLEDAGFDRIADGVAGVQRSTEKLRDSVYQTAEKMAGCLKNSGIETWVNPDPRRPRPEFDPRAFVRGSGTLYSLSKEGAGSAGPLVTALTAATIEAAEELAANSPSGRLPTPLLGVLDEAANVCRWSELADLYSHFGSRGIPMLSVFQSYSQGVAVFGRDGMRKLWSASTVKLYAGGVAETEFLGELSELIGSYDRETSSVSFSRDTRTVSRALSRERILEVQQLADLPRGRAVLFSSGARATLLRTVPWHRGPHANAIRASLAKHDPAHSER